MTDRPMIFSAPMIRALLAGTKTQTRRILKPQPYTVDGAVFTWENAKSAFLCGPQSVAENLLIHGACKFALGDRIWVREGFGWLSGNGYRYRADGEKLDDLALGSLTWRSPIFMPRAASRLTLTVTDVRVQRLRELSDADAVAEGMGWHNGGGIGHSGWRHDVNYGYVAPTARLAYAALWDIIHGPGAWAANPWVAALTFTVRKGNIDG